MTKEKINIIVPVDAQIFGGVNESVEQGWEDSVGPTIEQFAKQHGREIPAEKIKEYGDAVLSERKAELKRRAENPDKDVKYPKNILTKSYAILEGDISVQIMLRN